ncbi:glutathione S-transferase [Tranquillimonas rosea]|uniref:Glutathione S-transferase n=1 Tax=Tranquillimonas rosea TaxID=641238 RepID=A0A1H9U6G7_9RHOB|nr:glutathione S-transferase family protein [Tranquillimonas rosea]SES04818.1 glutathione S-transferase [Tranquillimonas rosea]
MYTLIGIPQSRAFRPLWMLHELGLEFEYRAEAPQSDPVLRHNPLGKVPVLLVDETPLTDSTAILMYLADRHDAFTRPAGTLDRARQDGVTHFLLDELDAALWTAARHSFILPEERRVPAIKDSLKWEVERALTRLSERLGAHPFLMGDDMTVPDIIAGHCLGWAEVAGFPTGDANLSSYLERLRDRPAYRKAAEAGEV